MEKDYLFNILKKELEGIDVIPTKEEVGRVVSVGDGVVQIEGLPNVVFSEMVQISKWPGEKNTPVLPALVLNLEEYAVGAVILGDDTLVHEGDLVRRTGKVLSIPVGEALLGRVVSPLGVPLDGKGSLDQKTVSSCYVTLLVMPMSY